MIPDTRAVQAAVSGARAEFAAAGALRSGAGDPRVVLDVLRVDERARGIQDRGGRPEAAGASVAVTVRARLFDAEHADPAVDTGDIRRAAQFAEQLDPIASSSAFDVSLREAAERAGRAAARALLGFPEPADEAP